MVSFHHKSCSSIGKRLQYGDMIEEKEYQEQKKKIKTKYRGRSPSNMIEII